MRGKITNLKNLEQLREIWLSHPNESSSQIHRYFENQYGKGVIALRTVQKKIVEFNQKEHLFNYVDWWPWQDSGEDPDVSSFLLMINAVCMAIEDRRLFVHEANWAKRLKQVLEGLDPYDQFCFVNLYATRTVRAYYSDQPQSTYTHDLDTILAYKPWLPNHGRPYAAAIFSNQAAEPPPYIGPNSQLGELSVYEAEDNIYLGQPWKTLRQDLRCPWHWRIRIPATARSDHYRTVNKFSLQDQMIRFWMGGHPIFEPPADLGNFDDKPIN